MDQVEIGLRRRVERIVRQIRSQHLSLHSLYSDLAAAFGKKQRARVLSLYERYAEAVCAYFALEEACLFPACRGLHSEIKAEVVALCVEHASLVERMKTLQERMSTEDAVDVEGAVGEFYAAISAHEKKEERLVGRLLVENSAPTIPDRVATTEFA